MPDQNAYDQAQQVKARLAERLAVIRANSDLSEDGRRKQVARAYSEAKRKIAEIRQAESESRTRRVEQLERRLFGVGQGDVAAYRQAISVAEAVKTEDEGLRLLARARKTGDDQLARALALVAAEKGMTSLLSDYRSGLPDGLRADLDGLVEAKAAVQDKRVRMADSMSFSLSKPPEISLANDAEIARLADQEPAHA